MTIIAMVYDVGNCDGVGDGDDNVDDGEEEHPHWLCWEQESGGI